LKKILYPIVSTIDRTGDLLSGCKETSFMKPIKAGQKPPRDDLQQQKQQKGVITPDEKKNVPHGYYRITKGY
jgi:CBS domain containing-hemolysin-like protein